MDIAYAGAEEMAVTVHATTGSAFTVVSLTGNDARPRRARDGNVPVDFDPFDLTTLVGYLARLLTTPNPEGALSIRVPDRARGGHLMWVWSLATMSPLRASEAELAFPGIDVPTSTGAYGCITDQGAPLPLMPVTDRVVMALVPRDSR